MYVKLFTSIYQGTLRGNAHGLLVFTNLMAHADQEGLVDVHPKAIAEEVGLKIDAVRAALVMLESPDVESRSPEEGGRRIVRVDDHRAWGWRIVNYGKYREIRNADDRREQNRMAQQRFREKHKKPFSAAVSRVSRGQPRSAHAEAEAYSSSSSSAPTLDEVLKWIPGAGVEIGEECARAWFDDRTDAQWQFKKGNEIFRVIDWQSNLRKYARHWRNNEAKQNEAAQAGKTRSPREQSVWSLKQRIEEAQEQKNKLKAGRMTKNLTGTTRDQVLKLIENIDRWKKEIAGMQP